MDGIDKRELSVIALRSDLKLGDPGGLVTEPINVPSGHTKAVHVDTGTDGHITVIDGPRRADPPAKGTGDDHVIETIPGFPPRAIVDSILVETEPNLAVGDVNADGAVGDEKDPEVARKLPPVEIFNKHVKKHGNPNGSDDGEADTRDSAHPKKIT